MDYSNPGPKTTFQKQQPDVVPVRYQDRLGNVQTDLRLAGDVNIPTMPGSSYTARNGDVGTAIHGRDFS